jgi:hypothetical protein
MDRQALERLLDREGIESSAYSLNGENRDETYVLDRRSSRWIVYYSERGLGTGIQQLVDEDSACSHLLDLLLTDSTTRRER